MKKKYVLIVDDQVINRVVLMEDFSKIYSILEAENGDQAIEHIKEHADDIELILLDLMMPVSDGFTVLDYLKESRKDAEIPVFIITADDSAETFHRLEQYLVADVITKPFMPKIITRRGQNVIKLYERKRKEAKALQDEIIALEEKNQELKDQIHDYERKMKNITKQLGL